MQNKLTKIFTLALIMATLSNITLAYNENDKKTLIETRQCVNCDLQGFEYKFEDFIRGNFDNINVMGSNLRDSQIDPIYMANVNFSYTDLSNANFNVSIVEMCSDTCTSPDSNFSNSKLINTTWHGYLQNIDFSNSDFTGFNSKLVTDISIDEDGGQTVTVPFGATNSSFKNVNFKNANLSFSYFFDSDFTNADFTNANLEDADFEGSIVTPEQIKQAKNICYVGLANGDFVIGRMQDDGRISMCEGFSEADMEQDNNIIL